MLSACSLGTESSSNRGKAPPPGSAAKLEKPNEPTAMDAFRAIAKPEGLKFRQLFAERIRDKEDRLTRLEKAVQELRNDFDTVVPTMVRLVSVESDMKDLVKQLQSLGDGNAAPVSDVEQSPIPIPGEDVARGTETAQLERAETAGKAINSSSVTPEAAPAGNKPPEGAASPNSDAYAPVKVATPPASGVNPKVEELAKELVVPKAVTPVNKAPAQKPATPQPAVPMVTGEAKDIRIGDHPDKTRIVVDISADAKLRAELSANGKQLVIDLAGLSWAGKPSWLADGGMLVSQWKYQDGKLIIDLIGVSMIKMQSVMAPKDSSAGYRFVVDLSAAGIHQ